MLILLLLVTLVPAAMGQKHYEDLTYGNMPDFEAPKPTEIKLDNGMTVLLLEDHELPFIEMNAKFIAGSAWEPAEKAGLAGITGMVMRTGGSAAMPGDQVDEDLEAIAASVETYIATLYGGASLSTLKDHFNKVFAIYVDLLMNPAFPEDKIDLAKIEYKSGISRRNDNVGQIANREFNQLIYGDNSPYTRDAEYATIDAITREDIVGFHKKWVRPNGMVLGVWGDFKTKDMVKKIKKAFRNWKPVGGTAINPPKVDYAFENSVNLVEKTDVNQSNIYMGHIGGLYNNPDRPALVMMNQILSGGFSSRLFSRVRSNQGLAYNVSGIYGANFIYPGVFYMQLSTQSGRTVEAIRSLRKELKTMTEEMVTDEELKIAKDGWLNSFVFNFDSIDEIMGRAVTYTYYGYPMDFLENMRDKMEAVSKEDVLRVSQTYLKPEQIQVLVVGNPSDFDEPLTVLGEVNDIDIRIPVPEEAAPEATEATLEKGNKLFTGMIEALGGADMFSRVSSYQWKGEATVVTPQGEMGMTADVMTVLPDRLRANITMPMGEMSQILNGDQAWLVSPQGTMAAPGAMKDELTASLWRDLVVLCSRAKDENLSVQYIGIEDVNGTAAAVLLFQPGDLQSFKIALDQKTSLPVKMSYQGKNMMGAPVATDEMFLDYRDISGIQFPFKIVKLQDGEKAQVMNASEIAVNVDVDDSQFVIE
jgi:predicted Zn-dependent peptidase